MARYDIANVNGRAKMTTFQSEKQIVRNLYRRLETVCADQIDTLLQSTVTDDYFWRGFHPFNEIRGGEAVANHFWAPLISALTSMQRRMDIFFAGVNSLDGPEGVWVVSMGHLMGLFDKAWLGIQPTGKMVMLRYCEFNRLADDKIIETAMYFDIPHLMMQAGLQPFPTQTGEHIVQPGPMTHDGLLFEPQPSAESDLTLAAINAMISDLGQWNSGLPLEDELRRTWDETMTWWGPAGIGSTYSIERYAKQHAGPFRAAFTKRSKTKHLCRMAEGHYGGFFGWPNFTATLSGHFMGMPATGLAGEFRVIDIYRRKAHKLVENWVFIDMLHFWKMQGLDILGQMKDAPNR